MSKIVGSSGESFERPMPDIQEIKPVGSMLLVEMLTKQELHNTKLTIVGEESVGMPPQAYVIAAGPGYNEEAQKTWGIKVGDRVVLQGSYVPVPDSLDKGARDRGVVEPHMVKAVLKESE